MAAELSTHHGDRDPRPQLTAQEQRVKFSPMATVALGQDDEGGIYGRDRLRFRDLYRD
jgi:hypothetical protein